MSSNLKELLAQKAALDQRIEEAQRNARAEAIAQVKALMAEYGLTAADLQGRDAPPRTAAKKSGAKVAPKYRDPASGNTWSGRGLQPKWLKAQLAAGRKLEDFRL